jgi:hypothetical protein
MHDVLDVDKRGEWVFLSGIFLSVGSFLSSLMKLVVCRDLGNYLRCLVNAKCRGSISPQEAPIHSWILATMDLA